jgi:hypothetical protein
MHRAVPLAFAISFAIACGCGPTTSGAPLGPGSAGTGGSAGNGAGTGGAGLPDASLGGASGGDAANCGVETFMLERGLPPDLLIVLDRSMSMADSPAGGGASKWIQVTGALRQTVMNLQGQIKWGLSFFPSDDSCGVASAVDVAVAPMSFAAIDAAMTNHSPGGGTPTQGAIRRAGAYLTSLAEGNPKYLLLATDGAPNCATTGCVCPPGFTQMGNECCLGPVCLGCSGGPDEAGAISAVGDVAAMGVHTFVIGISTGAAEENVLNQMAQRGMEPRSGGPPYYYPVASAAQLVDAVSAIAGRIISCTFALDRAPPYPDRVSVTAGGQEVPRDPAHGNGWDLSTDGRQVQLYGSWCARVQTGQVTDLHAIFGCPPVTILAP